MPLLVDHLPVWDICFRWAGHDPHRLWLRLPLPVKDNFRMLMDAILKGELACMTITLEKRKFEPDEEELSVYHWIDDIYECIQGISYNRKMLRSALVERIDLKLWCERMNAPLPEFWFPMGWNLTYEPPEGDLPPGYQYYRRDWTPEDWQAWKQEQEALQTAKANNESKNPPVEPNSDQSSVTSPPSASASAMENAANKMRPNQEARITCQQIAKAIWQKEPNRTIASVVRDDLIQIYGNGSFYADETVREWVKVVAPPPVKDRRGRPPKGDGNN